MTLAGPGQTEVVLPVDAAATRVERDPPCS